MTLQETELKEAVNKFDDKLMNAENIIKCLNDLAKSKNKELTWYSISQNHVMYNIYKKKDNS